MITSGRLLVLLIAVVGSLGAVFLLPESPKSQPLGIVLELPEFLGEWYGVEEKISEKERLVLGADTEFARKVYTNGRGGEIFVSVVLGGQDMNTSIHRPERCLPAQGWTIVDSRKVVVPLRDASRSALLATRLHNVRTLGAGQDEQRKLFGLNYYWFVGYSDVSASHLERTLIDIRDRILKGYNQRWAYITVAANVGKGLTQFGLDEAGTDKMLQDFVRRLVPEVHRVDKQ